MQYVAIRGGADSDIMIDVVERTRTLFDLPPIKYVFFNTGLEMKATKDHVKAVAEKYGVEIEEVSANEAASAAPAAPAPAAPAPAAAPAGATAVNAPMPGTILAVNVSNGASVKKGDVLMILEAMKMENEILAPSDGTVTSVAVSKGASVATGALLCTLG